jgi:hypothetical protein
MSVGLSERAAQPTSRADRLFFTAMAITVAVVVLVGFAPTYYLRPGFTADPLPAYLHVHGFVFSAWIVLLVAQTALVSARRTDLHRRLGWAGAATALLVAIVGMATAIEFGRQNVALGFDDSVRAFMTTPIFSMVVFVALAGSAVLRRHRPQAHKRLMLLATINLLDAPIARWPGAPGSLLVFALVDLFVAAIVVYDVVVKRRVERSTLVGGLLVVAGQALRSSVGQTAAWLAFARWLIG